MIGSTAVAGRTSALQSNVTAWKTGRNELVLTPVQRSPAKKAIKGAEVAGVDVRSEQPAALCNVKTYGIGHDGPGTDTNALLTCP